MKDPTTFIQKVVQGETLCCFATVVICQRAIAPTMAPDATARTSIRALLGIWEMLELKIFSSCITFSFGKPKIL